MSAQSNPGAAPSYTVFLAATSDYSAPLPATLDGVTVAVGQRILRTAQTTATQNGVYIIAPSGTNLVSGNFSSGSLTISGLTVGSGLIWIPGNGTSIVMNGVTINANTAAANGTIKVTATTLVIHGPTSAACTDILETLTAISSEAAGMSIGTQVHVTNGATNSGTWVYSAANTFTQKAATTTIATSGSSGAASTSAVQNVTTYGLLYAGNLSNLRSSGPSVFSGTVLTIDGPGTSKVATVWQWTPTANGTDDSATIITPNGYSSTNGRYLFLATL